MDDIFMQKWDSPFPRAIQLETTSICNSYCEFCPYDETSKLFPKTYMNTVLFDNIVNQLVQFQPQMIALYMNNEPLFDKRIFSRIKILRDKIPDVYLDFSTNGSILDPNIRAPALASSSIDEVKINFPSTDKEEYERLTKMNYDVVLNNIINFHNIAQDKGFLGRYRIIIVGSEHPDRDTEFWNNLEISSKVYSKISRGSIIPSNFEPKDLINDCRFNRQNEWMHILSSGEVVLCCMDWYHNQILGNLNNQSISQVWTGEKYQQVRNKIKNSTDKNFICNKCEWGI
jgi:MoaA/NifB/PqqE/SkfB family radical SAM enzyme